MMTDTDKTLSAILAECAAQPNVCALAKHFKSATEMETAIYALIDRVRSHPLVLNTTMVDYSILKSSIVGIIKAPQGAIPQMLALLDGLITGNTTAIEANTGSFVGGALFPLMDEALPGIRCADKSAKATAFEELEPVFADTRKLSKLGTGINAHLLTACAQWKFADKGRYAGPWANIRTKNPILLIGNTYDPVTPLTSAYNTSAIFPGSVVLEQRGYGVCSILFHPF